jgi:uncharacterized protein (DUF1800 family)
MVRPVVRARRRAAPHLALALAPALALLPPSSVPSVFSVVQQAAEAPDSLRVLHLLRRATYGVRPEDVDAAHALGVDAWLDRQLHPERIDDEALHEMLGRFPAAGMPLEDVVRQFNPRAQAARAMADSMRRTGVADSAMTPEMRAQLQRARPAALLGDMVGAKLTRAVLSERQLEEVMADFWFNHFNVFFGKGLTRLFVADYERSAIRPHVFGKFEDMLLATAQHPAMLFYLDNASSVAPDSMRPGARRPDQPPGRRRGLNENYARELMELHTLGVDGGYTQKDVIEVARALTGWTFVNPNALRTAAGARAAAGARPDGVGFIFRPGAHDRGEKIVLGHTLAAGRGIEDGLDVIHILATHPSTAKFIAYKLVERFASDQPRAEFVDELAEVFTRTGGDLREVTRALFTSERFYESRHIGTKVKTPYELVASALRVTRAEVGPSRRLLETLRAMGQLPYTEPAPTGFPASSEDWVNSGAMLARMNFGLALASNGLDGVRIDGARLLGATGSRTDSRAGHNAARTATDVLPELLALTLPGMDTRALEAGIRADLAGRTGSTPRADGARALGLIIGSPDFQKR